MKIALIALSGVRAYNEELTRLGMTLPGFVERSKVIASLPSLSLLTLAGLTPERFGVEYNLEDATMPRFELLAPERYNRLTVQTQRGCPWRCDFCASSITLTSRYKVKPVAKVVAEIRAIKSIWPSPFIEFADDNTFV